MEGARAIIDLATGWKFRKDAGEDAFYRGLDDSEWETVTVPHDWSVAEPFGEDNSSGTGYAAGGVGWYRKAFTLPDGLRGKRVAVTFDGVYNNSQVWCNGNNLGKRPYGYSSFTYDLTPFCEFGDATNVIAVKVSHVELADSRWFTGSGIYRAVRLSVSGRVRVAEHSPFVSTVEASPARAVLSAETEVVNGTEAPRDLALCHILTGSDGKVASRQESLARVPAFARETVRASLPVDAPSLWSPASPALYSLVTEIVADGVVLDRSVTAVGIRTFAFDPARGFSLNGEAMKIKGVCVHHDAGCLGAAVPPRVWESRLRALKDMGCNAIRMSHNPPDPRLLDLCDALGFLVMDEAFDEWEAVKNKWSKGHNVYPPRHAGYGDDFPDWHERDLKDMVRRDRNHPSIILWSVGNEVDYPNDPYCHPYFATMVGNNDANKPAQEQRYDPNKPNAERLARIAARLVALVKECDATRPVTAAIAFPELSNQTGYCAALDVVGYNYRERLYEGDHERYPERVLYGSENGAGYAQWLAVRDNEYISAQFIWTGIDYLGEARLWPVRASPAGFLDLAGFPKPGYFFRKSLWRNDVPVVFLSALRKNSALPQSSRYELEEGPHWDWENGATIEVRCYTNQGGAELFLNGESLGVRRLADSGVGYLSWDVRFARGTLEAVALDARDVPDGRSVLQSAGAPARLLVSSGSPCIAADGTDTARVEILVADDRGVVAYRADSDVTVAVEGPGALIGLENGDIADVRPYFAESRKAFRGHLAAYVRSTGEPGMIRVRATAPGLLASEVEIGAREV